MRRLLQTTILVAFVPCGCTTSAALTSDRDPLYRAAVDAVQLRCCSPTTGSCEPQRCRCGSDLAYTLWADKDWFAVAVGGLDAQVGSDVTTLQWGSFCPGGLALVTGVFARPGAFALDGLGQFVPEPWLGLLRSTPSERGHLRAECPEGATGRNAGAQQALLDAILAEFHRWLSESVREGELQSGQVVDLAIQPFAATADTAWVVVEPLHEIWEIWFKRPDSCNNPLGIPDGFFRKDRRIESDEVCEKVPRNCYTEADVDAIRRNAIRRSVVAVSPPN